MDHVGMILGRDLRTSMFPGGKKGSKRALTIALSMVLPVLFVILLEYGSFKLFSYVEGALGVVPGLADAVSVNLLGATALSVLIFTVMAGLQTTYKIVYESDEVGFLLAQPVPVRSVFVAKFLAAYVPLAVLGLGFGLPVWIGWGRATGAGAGFYLQVFAGLGVLILFAHSVLSVLLLVAMGFLPGRRMKQTFTALMAIGGVLVVSLSQVLSVKVGSIGGAGGHDAILEQIGLSNIGGIWYLPSTWFVKAVLGTIPRFGIDPLPYVFPLLGGAFLVTWLAVKVSDRTYLSGWAGRSEEQKKSTVRKRHKGRERGVFAGLKGTYWTVLRKDLKAHWRDPLIWYSLVVSAIALGFFVFNTARQSPNMGQGNNEMMGGLLIMMASLMGAVSSSQSGGISFSREGRSFWMLQANPTSAVQLLWAKLSYAFFPGFLTVTLTLVAAEIAGIPRLPFWLGLLLGLSISAAVSFLQILLDVCFPDFSVKIGFGVSKGEKRATKMLVTMFVSMALVILTYLVQAVPFILGSNEALKHLNFQLLQWISYGAVVALAPVFGLVVATKGLKKLRGLLSNH